ncbi:MAG: GTPase HflX [Candidatus Omnitrophica bacterium]|nr:GTPase HflX [Candidatus Omnitrophota bacterium]
MEKALLVTVDLGNKRGWTAEEMARELKDLATSSGALVAHETIVRRDKISPSHFIGTGKAEEICEICQDMQISLVIFNNDLTGTQQKNLEEIIQAKTVDRTQLILDIFARRARSNEGKIQVELAQLLYLLPRLAGKGIFLSRLGGGIGTRGPGEQKIEVDRRRIRERISKLKKDLGRISKQRLTRKKQRKNISILTVAIIGYTNAGKSTLLNSLTGSSVPSENRLFSTLDPTIRAYTLPNNQKIMLSDTVGFLDRLPHNLVESFKATLEEVIDADVLIEVLDASHPKCIQHRKAVSDTLKELKAEDKPIIYALNKMDNVENQRDIERLVNEFGDAVPISALYKKSLDKLIDKIVLYTSKLMTVIKVTVPQHNTKAVKLIHEHTHILKKEYRGQSVYIEAQIPFHLKHIVEKML